MCVWQTKPFQSVSKSVSKTEKAIINQDTGTSYDNNTADDKKR